jgi:glutamyl-tRNA(Gln) amidotransferase subunit E
MPEAIATIDERCRLALQGVPNETRKALADGTTIFERVLPGPDRMYPDTDSTPIPIEEDLIRECRKRLAVPVDQRMAQLKDWGVPIDTYDFIFRNNLMPLIEKLVEECGLPPIYSACLFGHTVKNIEGKGGARKKYDYARVYELCHFVVSKSLDKDIIKHLLPLVHMHQELDMPSILTISDYKSFTEEEVIEKIPDLQKRFALGGARSDQTAEIDWLMGQLRIVAVGNVSLNKLRTFVEEAVHHG